MKWHELFLYIAIIMNAASKPGRPADAITKATIEMKEMYIRNSKKVFIVHYEIS